MIFLLLPLFACSLASELSCSPHFPIKESVDILRRLVAKYAIPVVRKDENGSEWTNNLIMRNQGLEIDGTRYYLNDNRLPPEMTFYFDNSLLFDPVPIFVVEEDQLKNWRPDFSDKTYALTKISHECEVGQRACGLKCCQRETYEIQKGILELAQGENLSSGITYSYNDVVYSLEIKDNSSVPECSYGLSFYDILARKGKIDGKPISTIYFSCPEKHTCCGLSCMPSPEFALLREPRRVEVFSFKFDQRKKNIFLMTGAALAFIAFVVITALNYRNASKSNGSKARSTRRSVDTQTSSISLHLDADSRTLLRGSHLA